MTEQEDISSCYFTIKENLESLNKLFGHALPYVPDFDVFVWRLPSGTQANPQAKCENKRGLRKFGAIPHGE